MLECKNCPYYDYALGGQWCDKVGGYNYRFGYCSDIYDKETKRKNRSKQKRRNKIERDQKHKDHLKFLAENIQYYPSPVIYNNEIWIKGQGYVENSKPYYKRLYRGRGRRSNSKFCIKKVTIIAIMQFFQFYITQFTIHHLPTLK